MAKVIVIAQIASLVGVLICLEIVGALQEVHC